MSTREITFNLPRCYLVAAEDIRHTQEEIAVLESFIDVGGYDYSRVRVRGASGFSIEDSLYRLDCRKAELSHKIDDFLRVQECVDMIISDVKDNAARTALHMHCMEGSSVAEMANQIHYSRKHVYEILRRSEPTFSKCAHCEFMHHAG